MIRQPISEGAPLHHITPRRLVLLIAFRDIFVSGPERLLRPTTPIGSRGFLDDRLGHAPPEALLSDSTHSPIPYIAYGR